VEVELSQRNSPTAGREAGMYILLDQDQNEIPITDYGKLLALCSLVYVLWFLACRYAYRFVCIPMLFKSRNRIQIKTEDECKMSMLLLDQCFMLFPMVHLILV
jgi:hypothetical protein